MSKTLFPHNKELDSLPIVKNYEDIIFDEDFYRVDKKSLLETSSREERLTNNWDYESKADKVFFERMVKTVFGISKFISGKTVQINFEVGKGSFCVMDEIPSITIAIDSLTDHRIPFHARVNNIIALNLHETAHVMYTIPGIGQILKDNNNTKSGITKSGVSIKKPDFKKLNSLLVNKLHSVLHNIVEDRRIEAMLLQQFPGYVFYFDELKKYALFQHVNSLIARKKGFEDKKKRGLKPYDEVEFYNCLTQYITYKTLLPEALPYFLAIAPEDGFEKLMRKVDDIINTEVWTSKEILAQSKRLLELYPKDQQSQQPQSGGFALENPMTSPEQFDKQNGNELTEEQKELVEGILEEFQQLMKKQIPNPKVISENARSYYDKFSLNQPDFGQFDPLVHKQASDIAKTIQRSLAFLDSRFNRPAQSFELHAGELDEDELFSLKFNKAIFTEEEIAPGYSLDFGVLVDESGSMGSGKKIQQARVAGLALALALNNHPFINLFVYGHSADQTSDKEVQMYCYYDKFEKQTDINGMFSIRSRANNADGYAIAKMGDIMQKGGSKQKVLVVISDGQPAARGYGGESGIQHTREMVTYLEKKNYFVVQICVDNIRDSPRMFTHFIPYGDKDLGTNLKKVLLKKLTDISTLV